MAHTRYLGFTAANFPAQSHYCAFSPSCLKRAHILSLSTKLRFVSYWHGLHINIPLEACLIFSVQWYGCSQAVTAFCHIYDNHQLSYPLRGALKLQEGVV